MSLLCSSLAELQTETTDPLSISHVWRASELAVSRVVTSSSGHALLDDELPGAGWPRSSLVELLVQQSGIGELQLLKPLLARLASKQRIALVQPPYIPQSLAFKLWGIDTRRLLWLRPSSTGDALWSTEQILKNGSCGAVVFWQNHIRSESLRRLNLAAQGADIWFWLIRPMAAASEASPASLRLGIRPALGGAEVEVLKRRGPVADKTLFIPLPDMPTGRHPVHHENAPAVNFIPAAITARDAPPVLV
jgi:protein ImuA